jgi:hypothetical protein
LGTETEKFIHQRLERYKERKIKYSMEKVRRQQAKKRKRTTKEKLTSFNEEVVKPPLNWVGSSTDSTLALFGEGARGLAAGAVSSTPC